MPKKIITHHLSCKIVCIKFILSCRVHHKLRNQEHSIKELDSEILTRNTVEPPISSHPKCEDLEVV